MGVHRNRQSLPSGVVLAPLWRRAIALLIDLSVVSAFIGLVTALVSVVLRSPARCPRQLMEKAESWERISWRMRMMVVVPALAFGLHNRNRRSPGARAMGLRHVQLSTGGQITVRSVLIKSLASDALKALRNLATGPMVDRATKRWRDLQPQIRDLERQHAGDKAALERAMMDFYREQKFNPLSPLVRSALPSLAVGIIPVLLSPRRQSIPDLLAGVVVVTDSPASTDQSGGL